MRNGTQSAGDHFQDSGSHRSAVSAFLNLSEKVALLPASNATSAEQPGPMSPDAACSLLRAIESDIIPRLLLAHSAPKPSAPRTPADRATLGPADHDRFLDLVLTDTGASARAYVASLIRRGVSQETIFLDLLANAARQLGELWDEDRVSFSDVTIGLCRLHEVLREHGTILGRVDRQRPADGPRILMATACADQHVFGAVMVAEFFRRAGWRVWSEPGAVCDQLSAILSDVRFDVLGLSAHRSALADDVASEISSLRKASCNTDLRVLVGGHLFLDDPDLVERVGADGSGADARAALATATALVARPGTVSC